MAALWGDGEGLEAVFARARGALGGGEVSNPVMVAEREVVQAEGEASPAPGGRWAEFDHSWRRELAAMDPAALRRAARDLVTELQDDEEYRNAKLAMRRLRLMGEDAIPALQDALASTDEQQRRYAVSLLIELNAPLTDKLLFAAFHNLEDDHEPGRRHRQSEIPDDSEATRLLIESGPRGWDYAVSGLYSTEPQRRFLSAIALAHSQSPRAVDLTVTVLAGHLRDNEYVGDAGVASRALFAMGDKALPQLRRLRSMPGAQARKLVALVIREIEDPSPDKEAAYERAKRIAPTRDGGALVSWRFGEDRYFGLERRR